MIIAVCILQNMHVEHETVQWFIFSFLYNEYISVNVLKIMYHGKQIFLALQKKKKKIVLCYVYYTLKFKINHFLRSQSRLIIETNKW